MSDPQNEPFRMVISDVAFVKSQGVLIMGHVDQDSCTPEIRFALKAAKITSSREHARLISLKK